jgi:ribonuclease HII
MPNAALPTLEFEHAACAAVGRAPDAAAIAGVDEAGRGALAGPVTAGAVILPLGVPAALAALAEVNDSKQLTATRRSALFELITAHALAWGVASTPAAIIDAEGIMSATRLAMVAALEGLGRPLDFLLIDGRIRLRMLPTPQQSIIRGDARSLSIAAASVLAKVTRDRFMAAQEAAYPAYGFASHKGYGTARHLAALRDHGPTPLHRRSFAPLKRRLLE